MFKVLSIPLMQVAMETESILVRYLQSVFVKSNSSRFFFSSESCCTFQHLMLLADPQQEISYAALYSLSILYILAGFLNSRAINSATFSTGETSASHAKDFHDKVLSSPKVERTLS